MASKRRRDEYGRRPTSDSRGRTQDRIMRLQHAPDTIPGADEVLARAGERSIAAGIVDFHGGWVAHQPVTTRRSYERSLALLVRDLDADGPDPAAAGSVDELDPARLVAHLDWRIARGMVDDGELQRAALHAQRLAEWLDERHGTELAVSRDVMRAAAAERIAALPPTYHAASDASQLRDTSGDAGLLGGADDGDAGA